jgi:hypothetical protein
LPKWIEIRFLLRGLQKPVHGRHEAFVAKIRETGVFSGLGYEVFRRQINPGVIITI